MSGFSINHIVLSGNLTRDPELRHTGGGTPVLSLRIANNIRKKDRATGEWGDTPHYFDVTIWMAAEHLAGQLSKGDKIVVEGRMEWREWQPEGADYKRQAYDVIAESVVTVGSGGGGGGDGYRSDVPADTADFAPTPAPAGRGTPDDDIPF